MAWNKGKQHHNQAHRLADQLLQTRFPPVARFRLLSNGMEAYHRLFTPNCEVTGDKACLACGNCMDSCPVLRKEPARLEKTPQRTSFALEDLVGEDCEICYSCILSCPQVDMEWKDYIVDEKITEVIPQSKKLRALDNYFAVIAALLLGVVIGVFLVW